MRTATAGVLALILLATGPGCSDRKPAATRTPAPPPKVATTPTAPPAVAPTPVAGSELVDPVLASVQAFNLKAAETLTLIGSAERRFQLAAERATAVAARGDAPAVAAARREADAARASLTSALTTFRADAETHTTQLASAMAACAETPALAAHPACLALPAEQTLLTSNVTSLSQRFEAAEVAFARDRARLDEASATIALSAAVR